MEATLTLANPAQTDLLIGSILDSGSSTATSTTSVPFHFDDCIDQFFRWPFGTGPTNSFGRKQQPVLLLDQHFVKIQQRRGLQDDSRPQDTRRTHQYVHKPAMMRSEDRRLEARFRPRFRIRT